MSAKEGVDFARQHGCLYKETSAKADTGGVDEGVYDALVWGMVCTILDTPGLTRGNDTAEGGAAVDLEHSRRESLILPGCCLG